MYPIIRNFQAKFRLRLDLRDLLFLVTIVALVCGLLNAAEEFGGVYHQQAPIENTLNVLPEYTAQTLVRMLAAYLLSLGFSLVYAYSAYHFKTFTPILIPLLDILQSIPVLSFLPSIVLSLIALFPGQRIGVEIAVVILIFTGMAWNMTFSFYQSLSNIPRELIEATKIYRLNAWQRFWTLELPSGIIGLVWNSVMSLAGGWFFLIILESFSLKDKEFTVPGLGSFLAKAAKDQNFTAICWGLVTLIGVIIAIDFLIWRPLIAWAEKFKVEMVEAENSPQSWVLDTIRRSPTLKAIDLKVWQPLRTKLDRLTVTAPEDKIPVKLASSLGTSKWINWLLLAIGSALVIWSGNALVVFLKPLQLADWQHLLVGTCFTALRVLTSLVLSLVITVPIGVTIGRDPQLSRLLQPIVQIAASVPATALFPLLMLALSQVGGGLEIGSILLMMLGTMWYILFNTIAGAQSMPSDLFEVAQIYKLSRWQRWQTVILPGIFPYLITGVITAVGGAWNASIVSEYIKVRSQTLSATGIGAIIAKATEDGNFPLLVAATIMMSLVVISTSRLVWRPLYRLAEQKYQLLL